MRKRKKRVLPKYTKKHCEKDVGFALIVSLMVMGVLTLLYTAQGTYLHLINVVTLFAFIFAGQWLVKATHGHGKAQGFYAAVLGAFGYWLFYRIYFYSITGDFWKTNAMVGDSLVNAVVNTVIIYAAYNVFMYVHKTERK